MLVEKWCQGGSLSASRDITLPEIRNGGDAGDFCNRARVADLQTERAGAVGVMTDSLAMTANRADLSWVQLPGLQQLQDCSGKLSGNIDVSLTEQRQGHGFA